MKLFAPIFLSSLILLAGSPCNFASAQDALTTPTETISVPLTPEQQALTLREDPDLSMVEKRQQLQQLVNSHPDLADGWTCYGEVLEELGDDKLALRCFEKAVELDDSAYTPWLWIGILQKRGNPKPNLEVAESAFRKAIENGGPKARCLNELGVTLAIQGRFDEAVPVWEEAIAESPDWGVLYGNILKAAARMGNMELGTQYIIGAINAERFQESSILVWGDYLVTRGKEDQAVKYYRKAIAVHPDLPRLHYYMAMALAENEAVEEAKIEFRKTQELALNVADAADLIQAVEFNLFRLDYPKDEREFQQARELIFENDPVERKMKQKLEKGVSMIGELAEEHPRFWNLYFVRGIAWRRLMDPDKARADFEKVLEIFPDEPNATMQLAMMAQEDHDYEQAAKYAEKALELAPRDPTFAINAGIIMIDHGNCDRAWELYRNATKMVGEENCIVLREELDVRCIEK